MEMEPEDVEEMQPIDQISEIPDDNQDYQS